MVAVWLTGLYFGVCLLGSYLSQRLGVSFTICALKRFTGLPCPLCGGTRAALALLQGHLAQAIELNPLTVALYLLGPLALGLLYGPLRRCQPRLWRSKLLWVAVGLIVVANWCYLIRVGR